MSGTTAPGEFFHGFADVFDTFYDGKRSPIMQWVDRYFRHDMFERYRLTFVRLGELTDKYGIDIGCGSGPYVVEALRRGARHMMALDPAPRMLELTRQRVSRFGGENRVTCQDGYFPAVTPPGPFDFAIVMGVLDYVADAPAFLRALRGIVTGVAVLSFPSKHWLRTPIRAARYRLRQCPVYFYDASAVHSLAGQSGWSRVDIHKIAGAGMDYHVCLRP
jgi:SAM-dependent methyltransferase